jgi:hypothetical protein
MQLWQITITEAKKDNQRMKQQHHSMNRQHSRRDARARVRGWAGFVAAAVVAAVPMLGTLTTKINPCGVSGGLPREENS